MEKLFKNSLKSYKVVADYFPKMLLKKKNSNPIIYSKSCKQFVVCYLCFCLFSAAGCSGGQHYPRNVKSCQHFACTVNWDACFPLVWQCKYHLACQGTCKLWHITLLNALISREAFKEVEQWINKINIMKALQKSRWQPFFFSPPRDVKSKCFRVKSVANRFINMWIASGLDL